MQKNGNQVDTSALVSTAQMKMNKMILKLSTPLLFIYLHTSHAFASHSLDGLTVQTTSVFICVAFVLPQAVFSSSLFFAFLNAETEVKGGQRDFVNRKTFCFSSSCASCGF